MTSKSYLGDGAYAEFDGFGSLVLTTENGIETTNTVVLEPEAFGELLRFVAPHWKFQASKDYRP